MAAGSKERSEPPPEARLLPGTESETPLRYIRSVFIQIPDAAVKGRALLANRTQFGKKKTEPVQTARRLLLPVAFRRNASLMHCCSVVVPLRHCKTGSVRAPFGQLGGFPVSCVPARGVETAKYCIRGCVRARARRSLTCGERSGEVQCDNHAVTSTIPSCSATSY